MPQSADASFELDTLNYTTGLPMTLFQCLNQQMLHSNIRRVMLSRYRLSGFNASIGRCFIRTYSITLHAQKREVSMPQSADASFEPDGFCKSKPPRDTSFNASIGRC